MLAHPAGHVGNDRVTIGQFDAKPRVGHDFVDHALHFNHFLLRHMPRAAISMAIGDRAQERDLVWIPSHLLAMERPVIAKRIEQRGVGSDRGKGTGSSAAVRIIHVAGVSSRARRR